MDATVYDTIRPVVEQAARSASRWWPSLELGDVEGEAWVIALEALANYDPDKGSLVGYVSRALKIGLRNACYRMVLPVHFPKNREWTARTTGAGYVRKVSMGDDDGSDKVDPVVTGVAPGCAVAPDIEGHIDMARAKAAVRSAVIDATDDIALRSVMLSGGEIGPRTYADIRGVGRDQAQRETRKVYDRLRDTVTTPRSVLYR